MKLNTQQLSEIKQELKKFSTAPIQKSYQLIAQVYKGQYELQSIIESQITKSFVRIGQKKYTDEDDEKYAKAIKICRKLVKQWKQVIISNDLSTNNEDNKDVQKSQQKQKQSKNNEPQIQKKLKNDEQKQETTIVQIKNQNNIKSNFKENQNTSSEYVQDDKRKKAIDGLTKYFYLQTKNEHIEWSKKIEQTIYDLYKHSVQIYMDKVKSIVRMIDRDSEFREKLLEGEFNLISEITNLK
ncbi:unnamed protein product [Paramecium primaurelia]|uniref:Uncharacterized protein n=1 Tax=Paramecium primaurelia TaxID=5886 RepID=A0A8S1P9U1_PARPR|nr:unnamed protein product [Paramecium primaurelia]